MTDERRSWRADTLLTNAMGDQLGPWALERAFRAARAEVEGLPTGFRYQICGTTWRLC
jgi:hypothetical protein